MTHTFPSVNTENIIYALLFMKKRTFFLEKKDINKKVIFYAQKIGLFSSHTD